MRCTIQSLIAVVVLSGSYSVFAAEPHSESPKLPEIVTNDPLWDWIRLDTGEWLKGELITMERDTLEFDSDNLGDLSIDWDDIRAVYTDNPMAILLVGGQTASGKLVIDNDQIFIGGTEYPVPYDDILRITSVSPREIDLWRGDIAVGLSIRSGNVEERDLDTSARFVRRSVADTFRLSYVGNYTKNNDVESANNHRANTSYDYRLSRRWYLQLLNAEYYRDKFQNIDTQWQVGLGASYYIMENSSTFWTVSAGPGYQETRYFDVPDDDDTTVSSGVFVIRTEYDHELTSNIDVYGKYDITFAQDSSGGTSQHLIAAIDVDLIGGFDLRISADIYYIESPQADEEGVTPDNTDTSLTFGLSYDL